MNTRPFLISLVLGIIAAIAFLPTHSSATQSATVWAWCMSDPSAPTVYFAGPFDSGMSAQSRTFNGLSLGRQFAEYLSGRYDTRGDASCSHGASSIDQAAASQRMREVMAQMRQQNKQTVEVSDWNYLRDEVAIKASLNTPRGDYVNVEGGLPPDHMYCVTDSFNNKVYYAEPIALTNPSHNPSAEYFRFLQQKYSFKGNFKCSGINEPQAKLYLNARLAGARAGGKQVVNSGWPPANFTTTAEAPNDRYKDNDQPAQRPTANQPTPSAQVRDIAAKEVTPALTYCHSNNAMQRGYDCACLQVKVYDYRIKHPAETLRATPTLASLFNGTVLEPEKCITDAIAKRLAHDAGYSAGLKLPAAQDCAAEKFVASLHANPVPAQAQAELDAAFKACRR
jgi:hypothetical protein